MQPSNASQPSLKVCFVPYLSSPNLNPNGHFSTLVDPQHRCKFRIVTHEGTIKDLPLKIMHKGSTMSRFWLFNWGPIDSIEDLYTPFNIKTITYKENIKPPNYAERCNTVGRPKNKPIHSSVSRTKTKLTVLRPLIWSERCNSSVQALFK